MSYYEEPEDDEPTDDMMFRREFWFLLALGVIIFGFSIYLLFWN